MSKFSLNSPVRVGLVGTGYAAKMRAETLNADERAQLVGVTGHTPEHTQEFGHRHQVQVFNAWQELISSNLDVVAITGVNRDHGAIAHAALQAGKHVIVEYPLALTVAAAEACLAIANRQNLLLHVEHIELLGGLHQAFRQTLPQLGTLTQARYATVVPNPAPPQKWTYSAELFGFPLMAALSRLHRLVDAFGAVATVQCQNTYRYGANPDYYVACMCAAQLQFHSGLVAEVVYAKGEIDRPAERKLEAVGDRGKVVFDGEEGTLITAAGSSPIAVVPRRGLFAQDTQMVLDRLIDGTPLYVTAEQSLSTLKVAAAAQRSAATQQLVTLDC
jgi:biliverdin reductase